MVLNDAHVRYTAAEYNRYTQTFVKPYDEMLLGWVRTQAKDRSAFTLVDIGTGTAQFLIQLALLPEFSNGRLIGTDLFEDMIAEATIAAKEAGVGDRIELLEDDVHASILATASADLIISRSTLHHWSNPTLGLKEIYRILRPGGRALVMDVRRDAPEEAVSQFNRLRAQAGIGPSVLDEKFTVTEVRAFLEQAGIAEHSKIDVGGEGLAALGMGISMKKPREYAVLIEEPQAEAV